MITGFWQFQEIPCSLRSSKKMVTSYLCFDILRMQRGNASPLRRAFNLLNFSEILVSENRDVLLIIQLSRFCNIDFTNIFSDMRNQLTTVYTKILI